MKILIACECSGIVRDAFRARGHDAWSCDIKPDERKSSFHFHEDIRILMMRDPNWDMLIGHPECTYVNGAGIHWNNRGRGWDKTEAAVDFFRWMWTLPIPRMVLENPVGILSTRICKPTQIIQPYEFGHDASKKTCLWIRGGLRPLRPTCRIPGREVICNGKLVERWANQTDSGQNRLAPSEHRAADRSRTYEGIARAMAAQWPTES